MTHSSCFSSIGIAAYPPGAMAAHSHDENRFCIPLAGRYVERRQGRETRHELGHILYCAAGERHAQQFMTERTVALLLAPTAQGNACLAGNRSLTERPLRASRALIPVALRLASEIRRPDPFSGLIAEGIALEILGLFARAGVGEASSASWLRAARDFVCANACRTIRLADVAAHVQRDPVALSSAYRGAFGCTIGEDARALRLSRAAAMLASSREPIAAIASDCGYFDQAHFTRAFRRAYGVTPAAYRASFN